MAVDCARRLSFGASKVNFPMDKYLSSLDDFDISEFNCFRLAKSFQPQMEQEYHILQDQFKKLKLYFIQLHTKRRFLENLSENPEKWNLHPDTSDMKYYKQKFKAIKANNEQEIENLKNLVTELIQSYETYKTLRSELFAELEEVKKLIDTYMPEDDTENMMIEQKPPTPKRAPKPREPNHLDEWFSGIATLVSDLSGLEVLSYAPETITIKIQSLYILTVQFNPNTDIIYSAELSSMSVPIDDLVEHVVGTNNISFLLSEIKARISNHQKRVQEVDTVISQRSDWNLRTDGFVTEVSCTFPTSSSVTLRLELDYPQQYTRIKIAQVDGISTHQHLEAVKQYQQELDHSFTTIASSLQRLEKIFQS